MELGGDFERHRFLAIGQNPACRNNDGNSSEAVAIEGTSSAVTSTSDRQPNLLKGARGMNETFIQFHRPPFTGQFALVL